MHSKKIQASLANLEELLLGSNHIFKEVQFSAQIEFSSTVVLDVSRNALPRITFLKHFPKLKHLDVHHNPLGKVTTELEKLPLEHLDISETNIDAFPVFQKSKMRTLCVSGNEIRELPEKFGEIFPKLRVFEMKNNPLQILPDSLSSCSKLKQIDLQTTQFSSLPKQFAQLQPSLHYLNLALNKMEEFPSMQACALTNLKGATAFFSFN